ncbi:MAG TPA: hypothetical protein VIX63_05505 [Vicinamibacterales bacterium]
MGRCRFVDRATNIVRLPLSEGDFLDVRRVLTWGEQQDALASIVRSLPAGGGESSLHVARVQIGKALSYIVGWSFVDSEGRPQPVTEDTLRALDEPTGEEIIAALDAHRAAMHEERAQKKRIPTGVPALMGT